MKAGSLQTSFMNGNELVVGLLYEGTLDGSPLVTLVTRLSARNDLSFLHYKSEGPILKDLSPAAKYFFDGAAAKIATIGVYVSDADKDLNRERDIKEWVEDYKFSEPTRRIAVAVPAPTFEQWFVVEEDCIKATFGLAHTEPLPFSEIRHPKARLIRIINEFGGFNYTMSIVDWYVEFAERINLQSLEARDASFSRFADSFRETLNESPPGRLQL